MTQTPKAMLVKDVDRIMDKYGYKSIFTFIFLKV